MAITYTRKQKDKFGNVWLRDKYGGWTNEYGVRFTKTEHRRFGYAIRKANQEIAKYMEKFPQDKNIKSTDIGSRFRIPDLSRFRKRSAYKNYLNVTKRIISGEQLYKRQPQQYQKNFIKALSRNELTGIASKDPTLREKLKLVIDKIKSLTPTQLIQLSRLPQTPDIYSYYVSLYEVQKANIEMLLDAVNSIKG